MQKNKRIRWIFLWRRIINSLRWFRPGLGVKRWLGVIFLGATLLAVGFAFFVLDIYRNAPETWWLPLLSIAALRALPRMTRVLIFGSIGLVLVLGGVYALNRTLLLPFRQPGRPVVSALEDHRRRESGPRLVAIGGGHGLSMLLRGLKQYTHNLYAIVTVADDGGSSGRLRRSMGILPPGDIRNCLAALSNDEALLEQLFQYRFANGGGELDGHSFGNLFITALTGITGSFEDAIAETGRVLAVRGRVYPSTLQDVNLVAEVVSSREGGEKRVKGESQIPEVADRIKHIWLEPNNPPAYPKVVRSLLTADMIIIGPGSLYTSILPNLLVPDINAAIRSSPAFKVYVCNVATQPGETSGFTCMDHVDVIEQHVGKGLFDLVIHNNRFFGDLYEGMEWVRLGDASGFGYPLYEMNLIDQEEPWHHDSDKLASVLINLFRARTGPLAER
jgi:uncharacterized cofD-like protein